MLETLLNSAVFEPALAGIMVYVVAKYALNYSMNDGLLIAGVSSGACFAAKPVGEQVKKMLV